MSTRIFPRTRSPNTRREERTQLTIPQNPVTNPIDNFRIPKHADDMDLITSKREAFSIDLPADSQCRRIFILNHDDTIWLPANNDTKDIYVYTIDGERKQLAFRDCEKTASCVQRNNGNQNVVVVSKNGLIELRQDGCYRKRVSPDRYCDVAFNGDFIVALGVKYPMVNVYCDSEYSFELLLHSSLNIEGMKVHERNTVLANKTKMFICCYETSDLLVYEMSTGHKIEEIKIPVKEPMLCLVTQNDNLLVASHGDNKILQYKGKKYWKNVTPGAKLFSASNAKVLTKVSDVVLDRVLNAWVLTDDGKKLTKYEFDYSDCDKD